MINEIIKYNWLLCLNKFQYFCYWAPYIWNSLSLWFIYMWLTNLVAKNDILLSTKGNYALSNVYILIIWKKALIHALFPVNIFTSNICEEDIQHLSLFSFDEDSILSKNKYQRKKYWIQESRIHKLMDILEFKGIDHEIRYEILIHLYKL